MPSYSAYSRIGIGEYSTGPVSAQGCYRLSLEALAREVSLTIALWDRMPSYAGEA